MFKKLLRIVLGLILVLAGVAGVLYARNSAPVVPAVSAADAAAAGKPYVVKLHARWCVVCMATKDEWTEIEKTYAGRVNLLVLDFTNDANIEAGRAEAARLGLQQFFDDNSGRTGIIAVVDARTKRVTEISGSRPFEEYRTAIDAALRAASR